MKFAAVFASLAGYASAALSSAGPDYQDPTVAAELAERELLALLDDEELAENNKASKKKKKNNNKKKKKKVAFLDDEELAENDNSNSNGSHLIVSEVPLGMSAAKEESKSVRIGEAGVIPVAEELSMVPGFSVCSFMLATFSRSCPRRRKHQRCNRVYSC